MSSSCVAPVLAMDIGGTKTACGLVQGGRVIHSDQVPTPASRGSEAVMDAAWGLAQQVMGSHVAAGARTPARLAVASAGVVDTRAGFVTSATSAIVGWAGTNLHGGFARRSGLPTTVLNDVHAHTWGEFVHGTGQYRRSMLLVAVGTGIGGGLVIDGRLLRGSLNAAGHFGHVTVDTAKGIDCPCGKTGHVEGVGSGSGIEARFHSVTGRHLPGAAIAQLALSDQPFANCARQIMQTAGHSLGTVLASIVNTVAPEVVVVTGSVTRAGEQWWTALREGFDASVLTLLAQTPIEPATLSNAAIIGVAAWGESPQAAALGVRT